MATEDDEPRDREVWNKVAKFWYNKASDKNPSVGRLNHHLAILARPCSLEQITLYTRSLTRLGLFDAVKASITTLFDPVLQGKKIMTLSDLVVCVNENTRRWFSSIGTRIDGTRAKLLWKNISQASEPLYIAFPEPLREKFLGNRPTKAYVRSKLIDTYILVAYIAALRCSSLGSAFDDSRSCVYRSIRAYHRRISKDTRGVKCSLSKDFILRSQLNAQWNAPGRWDCPEYIIFGALRHAQWHYPGEWKLHEDFISKGQSDTQTPRPLHFKTTTIENDLRYTAYDNPKKMTIEDHLQHTAHDNWSQTGFSRAIGLLMAISSACSSVSGYQR